MKKLFLSAISIALAASAYAIPNTFSEGDVISAEQMNENFESLINSNVLRATTVNCDDGETINGAIEKGFNDITVSGTCNENVDFTVWRDSAVDGRNPNGKLAPRLLKLSSGSTPGVIADASSDTKSTITVTNGSTLILENISVQGGTHTVYATRNSNLLMTGGVTVGGFTQIGIRIEDSSYLGVDEGGVTITGGTDAERGVYVGMGSSAWIHTSNISNVDQGIVLFGQSYASLHNFTIDARVYGVRTGRANIETYGDGIKVIQGTSEEAIRILGGSFYSWDGTLEIKDLQGGKGIRISEANGVISNLNMPDFDNTGTGWNPAISLDTNSSLALENAVISGSTDGALVSISDGSITKIENSTLTVGSASNAIDAYGSTRIVLRNSNISGSVTDNLVNIDQGSTAQIRNSSSISGSVGGALVGTSHGSSSDIRDSTFTLNNGNRALAVKESSNLEMWNSTLSGTATEELVDVRRLSNAIIRNESKLSQLGSDTPDVRVSNLSMLSIWNEEATINKVLCHSKGYVSADEGRVTDLDTNCTE